MGIQGLVVDQDVVQPALEAIGAGAAAANEQRRVVGRDPRGGVRSRIVKPAVDVEIEGVAILDEGHVMVLAVVDLGVGGDLREVGAVVTGGEYLGAPVHIADHKGVVRGMLRPFLDDVVVPKLGIALHRGRFHPEGDSEVIARPEVEGVIVRHGQIVVAAIEGQRIGAEPGKGPGHIG